MPPLDEQRRIADFLDTETARIDALLDARATQLALLAERRTLQSKGADRGVYITSSTSTVGARAAERDFRSIVLIDGPMLARLMVDHSVGVQVASTHVLKRLDQDYFDAL